MLNDQPATKDDIGREPFAKKIAKIITTQSDPAHQVIAIDGAWGEGKTTVFGFLERALKKDKHKVMWFNPWRHKDEEAMVRSFALEMEQTLGVDVLKKYNRWFETKQQTLEWVNIGADALSGERGGKFFRAIANKLRPSAESMLEDVKCELNQQKGRVTILVDDPDRLEADQLLSLFRLIKLIADFEKLTFVLAMDCAAVARTVGRRIGRNEGQRFLEKIIQVPLRLPAVPSHDMRKFTLTLIGGVVQDLSINISAEEWVRFLEHFEVAIFPHISSPRLAKQYANVARFALGFSKNEVNVVDVLLLEGLRLLVPQVFENLLNKFKATPSLNEELKNYLDKDNRSEKGHRELAEVLSGHKSLNGNQPLEDLLRALFPAKFVSPHDSYGWDEGRENWYCEKRVAIEQYMWRYLHCAVPSNDVPDAQFTSILVTAEASDIEATIQKLREIMPAEKAAVGVQKLLMELDRLGNTQRGILAVALASISDAFSLDDGSWKSENSFTGAARAAVDCVLRYEPANQREKLMLEVISRAQLARWTGFFFRSLPNTNHQNAPAQETDATSYDIGIIRAAVAEKMLIELLADEEVSSVDVLHEFNFFAQWWQRDKSQAWVEKWTARNPAFAQTLASALMGVRTSIKGMEYLWPGNENSLEFLQRWCDLGWFRDHVTCEKPPHRDRFDDAVVTPQEALYKLVELVKSQSSAEASCLSESSPVNE